MMRLDIRRLNVFLGPSLEQENQSMNTSRPCLNGTRWMIVPLAALVVFLAEPMPASAQDVADCEEWTVPARRARAENPIDAGDADLEEAMDLFLDECSECHGETGQNDGPGAADADMTCAPLLTDPVLLERTDGELFWKIREGLESMPNTLDTLRDQDRWLLVHYLRSLLAGETPPGD